MASDIATVEYAAMYLGIDSDSGENEPLLTMLCDAINQRIEDYCDRIFAKERHTEYHTVDRSTNHIYVKNPPIITLHTLTDDAMVGQRAITIADNVHTNNGDNFGEIRLWNTEGTFTQGERSVLAVYTGGYADDDLPADLRLAAVQMVAFLWEGPEMLARKQQAIDGQNIQWRDDSIPPQCKSTLDKYARIWVA